MWNVGYTTSKADKVKQGGFQRKPMTFCELTDFDNFEGFPKSCVVKMGFFHNHYGKFHKKNVFFIESFPKQLV